MFDFPAVSWSGLFGRTRGVVISAWFLASIFGPLPALHLRGWLKRRWLDKAGRCPS